MLATSEGGAQNEDTTGQEELGQLALMLVHKKG